LVVTGPTGADQRRPGDVEDWDRVLADQRRLYDEREADRAARAEPPVDEPDEPAGP